MQLIDGKYLSKKMFLLGHCVFLLTIGAYNVNAQSHGPQEKWIKSILNNEEISKRDYTLDYQRYDFSKLYLSNRPVYGFIGKNYTRIFIKFSSAIKDRDSTCIYHVQGKSTVGRNSTSFKGEIRISAIRLYRIMHWGVDDEYKNKGIRAEGLIFGNYNISEDSTQSNSGKFSGITVSYFYIDKNDNVRYDDMEPSDSGNNNQFAGFWKSNKSHFVKICNWGDYRIPLSGDLDIGAGDFSVNPKYRKFGWQDFKY